MRATLAGCLLPVPWVDAVFAATHVPRWQGRERGAPRRPTAPGPSFFFTGQERLLRV
jgi:hypothetical protein